MSFLYGDASPSPLQSNVIALLPDLLTCAVELLLADARLQTLGGGATAVAATLEADVAALEALGRRVAETLAASGGAGTVGRCATAIAAAATGQVEAELARVRAAHAAERAGLEADEAEARAGCVRALEAFLQRHDLPLMRADVRLTQEGARYQARLVAHTPWGLEAEVALEVPAAHTLAHVIRVDKLVERLEVQAPEEGGWLRKEVRLRPQRLDKAYLIAAFLGAGETTLRLRESADGSGAGFDVAILEEPLRVRMVRIGEGELPPFEVPEVDAERLVFLRDKLAACCDELRNERRALVEARFAETALGHLGSPRLVVEALVAAAAPVIQEIARHSPPNELVLKRLLGDGRREEIFIAKDQLRHQLDTLPPELRAVFAPLGLGDAPSTPPPPPQPATISVELEVER